MIVLAWDGVASVDGYRIYRATRTKFEKATKIAEVTDGCTYVDRNVETDPTYYYWVSSYNDLGESGVSEMATGYCNDPLEIATAELSEGMELVEYGPDGNGVQLAATGGSEEYAWELEEGFAVCATAEKTFAETGTAMGWRADDGEWTVELPFAFPTVGRGTANQMRVTSNGYLVFMVSDSNDEEIWFDPIERDLRTDRGGDIYLESAADHVTVRWDACRYGAEDEHYRFATTIYPDGRLEVNYGACDDAELAAREDTVMTYCYSALPVGLSLDGASGIISGVPVLASTNRVCIVCSDANYPDEQVLRVFELIVQPNPHERPVIDARIPQETETTINAGTTLELSVLAHDPAGDELTYQWYVDGEPVEGATNATYAFETQADDCYPWGVTIACSVSDDLWKGDYAIWTGWHAYVRRDFWPDAGNPQSLRELCANTEFATGDIAHVAPGRYAPFECSAEVPVRFVATGGADVTFIDGKLSVGDRCFTADCDGYYVQMEGFTLENGNGGASGCALKDCIIRNCQSDEDGGAACNCTLEGCYVYGNAAEQFGAAAYCTLTHCTVYGNAAAADENPVGGLGYCCVYDSIVVGNGTDIGFYPDEERWVTNQYVVLDSCLGSPWPGDGNVCADPHFVDASLGDFRLRTGSPCLEPRMGAYRGEPVAGHVVSADIVGHGKLDHVTAVVADGGTATFAVDAQSPRTLAYFEVDGERTVGVTSITISNVTDDQRIKAVFDAYAFYADAENGDDANDGRTAATAKATIQAAVDLALSGETVRVADGVYDPFAFGAACEGVTVESVNGKADCIIDGSGTNRCVTGNAYAYDRNRNTVRGLTLQNGFAPVNVSLQFYVDYTNLILRSHGGAAIYCQLEDCVVQNCRAGEGGGLYCCTALRTLIVGNEASEDVYADVLESCRECDGDDVDVSYNEPSGGGAYQSVLSFCTVVGSAAQTYGGGIYAGRASDTILWHNDAPSGGDVNATRCERCCVSSDDGIGSWSCLYYDDPLFADADGGDYRLKSSSPYVEGGKAWLGCFASPYYEPPSVPTGLVASEDLDGVIELSWGPASNAVTYRIYRHTRDRVDKATCIAETDACHYEDRDIECDPTYSYWVTAVNPAGESDFSDSVQGYCSEESEIEPVPDEVFDPEGPHYSDFSAWLVENEAIAPSSTNYHGQVVSAGRSLDAKGKPMWQDYVAGTDPYDEESVFTATIEMEDGVPVVRWDPELTAEQEQKRTYTTFGAAAIGEKWEDVSNLTDAERKERGYQFFWVSVQMK